MIIVTGGSGFIGSNLIQALNSIGHEDIMVIDDLSDGKKLTNLFTSRICEIRSFKEIDDILETCFPEKITAIFHLGACSDTMEWNGDFVLKVNYQFSKKILDFSIREKIPFIYASSASVYGLVKDSQITEANERPINLYAYSKLLFDQYVRSVLPSAQSQIVGLRYFNVYGPGEQHKGNMASVVYHFYYQVVNTGKISIFGSYNEIGAGEHSRDFIHVKDTVEAKIWFMNNPKICGIFNVGTGQSFSYNMLAKYLSGWFEENQGIIPIIEYIKFPEKLIGSYQDFTCADISQLRTAGFEHKMLDLKKGMNHYLDFLHSQP